MRPAEPEARARSGSGLEIASAWTADVYVSYWPERGVHPEIVRAFDRRGIRLVAEFPELKRERTRCEYLLGSVTGAVVVVDTAGEIPSSWRLEIELALALNAPVLLLVASARWVPDALSAGLPRGSEDDAPVFGVASWDPESGKITAEDHPALDRFVSEARSRRSSKPAYAFFVGRLERDFEHARAAIRVAVERQLGLECVWSDDGYRSLSNRSVRETTQQLIHGAVLILADLTLGSENPKHENPSRAHEIGFAIGCSRPLLLSSREPRRYPYFAIGDLQMTFWSDEQDLFRITCASLEGFRKSVGRHVLNHENASAGGPPVRELKAFRFDAARRYSWSPPLASKSSEWPTAVVALVAALIAFALVCALAVAIVLGWM